jgi:hypothetical protein
MRGAKPSSTFSKNKSLKVTPWLFDLLRSLCGMWAVSQSTAIRRALAVLADNPGLWTAYAEYAAPERLAEIEKGE